MFLNSSRFFPLNLSPVSSLAILFVLLINLSGGSVSAQNRVQPPDDREIFREDLKAEKRRVKKNRAQVTKVLQAPTGELDIKAPSLEFEKEKNLAKAQEGMILSYQGTRLEGDKGQVQTESKDTEITGRILMSGPGVQVSAEDTRYNLDRLQGDFSCASVKIEDGNYEMDSNKVVQDGEDTFTLQKTRLSTCECRSEGQEGDCKKMSGNKPWEINASTVRVTRDGYAHAYNAWMEFGGVPIFYSPYLGFPVKEKRQSGLLVPTFGHSSRDGFKLKTPIFAVTDESSDLLFEPFIETQTRHGSTVQYRQSLSKQNKIEAVALYSDERRRDGDLRGINTSGLYAPFPGYQYYDDDRFAGSYRQYWRGDQKSIIPLSFVADMNYVSDDLVLREMDDDRFGDRTEKDLVSAAVLSGGLGSVGSFSLLGEYSQALDQRDDDYVVQRLPEARLNLAQTIRPFGYNPYGAQLKFKLQALGDQFYRAEGYDGTRTHLVPSVTLPFHIKNYMQAALTYSYLRTDYFLSDTTVPNIATEQALLDDIDQLDDRSSRNIPVFSYTMSTTVERAFDVPEDSWLRYVTGLGRNTSSGELTRLKHTITPEFKFTNIPDVYQDDLPVFDTLGRIREKRVFTYGLRSSLFGKFQGGEGDSISELLPDVEDLPALGSSSSELPELGGAFDGFGLGSDPMVRRGETRELVRASIKQAYDYIEDKENRNPDRNAFSDLSAELFIFPSSYTAFGFDTNYNAADGEVDSFAFSTHFFDDRGDALRGRWTFVQDSTSGQNQVSQFEGNAEIKLVDRLKFGWYGRYDEIDSEMLESQMALRLVSSCNCWHADLGYGETLNPDKKDIFIRFTFLGLGDISQSLRLGNQSNQ